jgi:hypothetical protein
MDSSVSYEHTASMIKVHDSQVWKVTSVVRMDQDLRIYSLLLKISPNTCLITVNLQDLVSLFYSTMLSIGTLIQRRWRMNRRSWWNDNNRSKYADLQRRFYQCYFVSRKYRTDLNGIKRISMLCFGLWQYGLTWLNCDPKFAFMSWII